MTYSAVIVGLGRIGMGYDLDLGLTTDDLVSGDNCFFAATGITDGTDSAELRIILGIAPQLVAVRTANNVFLVVQRRAEVRGQSLDRSTQIDDLPLDLLGKRFRFGNDVGD